MGDRFAFATHLSQEIKDFVMEQLKFGLTMSQIVAKHRRHVKSIVLGTCELNRDMFLTEQDVRVLSGKLVQKTYHLHKNDAKSVRMWVQQKTNSMFYYREIGVEVDGGFVGQNMPFIMGIQTPWQREMMIEHGHQRGVFQSMQPLGQTKKWRHMMSNTWCMHM
jgi:hypothetical protein